jgi:hypothetical protein
MINLGPVTEREARDIIRAIRDEHPELARVLQKRLDIATGTYQGRPCAIDVMFGRAR